MPRLGYSRESLSPQLGLNIHDGVAHLFLIMLVGKQTFHLHTVAIISAFGSHEYIESQSKYSNISMK